MAPTPSELDVELAPIDARLEFIAQEKALIEQTLAELDATIQATPNNEMVLGGLERELANLSGQYDAAVANLGQATIGERIEVLSKGERFSLIEQPTEPTAPDSPNRMLIAAAGVVGGDPARARLHRAAGDAEPLDPPSRRRSPSGSAPSPSPRSPTSAPAPSGAGSAA